MKSLSERLKDLRTENNLSQQKLADKLTVPRSTLAGYETGISAPPYDILIKYANIFNTTTDFLLGRVDDQHAKITGSENIDVVHDKSIKLSNDELILLEKALEVLKNKK